MRNSRSTKGKFQVLSGYGAGPEFGSLGQCPFHIMGKCFEFRLLCPIRFTAQALPYT
jgi:hypothetical protein